MKSPDKPKVVGKGDLKGPYTKAQLDAKWAKFSKTPEGKGVKRPIIKTPIIKTKEK
jgi:hypothetical protein